MSSHFFAVQISYVVAVLVNILILTPICCYYTYKLWELRDDPILSKRYPLLTICAIIALLINSTIFRSIGDLPDIIPSINYGSLTFQIRLLVYNSSHVFFTLGIYRIWLLFYDYTRGLHLISRQWQSHLHDNDPNYYWTLKYSFLSHRSGKLLWICFLWVVFVEICILLSSIWYLQNVVQPIFLSIIVLFIIYLAFKVRSCRDQYFFYAEQKRIGITCAFYIIAHVLCVQIFNNSMKELSLYLCAMIASTAAIMVTTKWVIAQLAKRNTEHNTALSLKGNTINGIKFYDILKDQDAFEYFAVHLVSEYSLENLLFLYESMQFKVSLNELVDDTGLYLEFPQTHDSSPRSPRSQFIAISNKEAFMDRLRYIIHKYIVESSEYAVNISFMTRDALLASIHPNNTQNGLNVCRTTMTQSVPSSSKLESGSVISVNFGNDEELMVHYIGLLDDAIQEVVSLISHDSFYRFAQTAIFRKIFKISV